MSIEIASAVWGFLGALVGAGVSILTTMINNAHGSKIETTRAREIRIEAAKEFQKTTLLEIQDCLAATTHSLSNIYVLVQARERQHAQDQSIEASHREALNDRLNRISILVERVIDKNVRILIYEFLSEIANGITNNNPEAFKILYQEHGNRMAKVMTSIGSTLRSYLEPIEAKKQK